MYFYFIPETMSFLNDFGVLDSRSKLFGAIEVSNNNVSLIWGSGLKKQAFGAIEVSNNNVSLMSGFCIFQNCFFDVWWGPWI